MIPSIHTRKAVQQTQQNGLSRQWVIINNARQHETQHHANCHDDGEHNWPKRLYGVKNKKLPCR